MIKLDQNYSIVTDSNNYTLKFEESKGINETTGKEEFSRDEWHYGKLSQALDKYMNQSIKASKSVQELIDKLNEVQSIIEKV